jgi:GMP synthase PP-ATPase subunit
MDAKSFIDEKVAWIKKEVGDKKAICALSGGVDSSGGRSWRSSNSGYVTRCPVL